MHFQHHSKPNVIDKDPDTRIEALFLLGNTIPKQVFNSVFDVLRSAASPIDLACREKCQVRQDHAVQSATPVLLYR